MFLGIPNVEKMLVDASVVDIISTDWALGEETLPSFSFAWALAHGTHIRHCAWFDVAGRRLAVATATDLGNRGHLEQQNGDGGTRILHTIYHHFRSLYHVPSFFSLPLLFSRIPVPEVIQNKPASHVHGEQVEALRQHTGRPLRARRSHAVRPRAKPSSCTVGYKALREENNNSCR